MKIVFSGHSLYKIKERNLSQEKIIETVNQLDFVLSSYDNRLVAGKNFGKLNLQVIYQTENKTIIIITAYWHERRKK